MTISRTIANDSVFGGEPTSTAAMTASDWTPLPRNTLQGFFKLKLPSGLVLNDCTRTATGAGLDCRANRKIDADGRQRVDAAGKRLWAPVVEVPGKETQYRFQRSALAAVDAILGGAW